MFFVIESVKKDLPNAQVFQLKPHLLGQSPSSLDHFKNGFVWTLENQFRDKKYVSLSVRI